MMDESNETQNTLPREDPTVAAVASALTSLSKKECNNEHDDQDEDEDDDFFIPQRFTKSGRKRAVPFPIRLLKVLSNKEYADIISWMPSGKSFSIVKPKAFVADILPGHFKSAKYSSFTRKLHRWGFMRHYRGEESGAFYHELFQKDRLDLVEKMTCRHEKSEQQPSKFQQAQHAAAAAAAATEQKPETTASHRMDTIAPLPQSPLVQSQNMDLHQQQQQQRDHAAADQEELNSTATAERFHAAIEIEVARRLKERIAAAALSRQALAMMRPQTNACVSTLPEMPGFSAGRWQMSPAILYQQRKQEALLKQHMLKQALLQKVLAAENYASASASLQGSPFARLAPMTDEPCTNIQGAKTA